MRLLDLLENRMLRVIMRAFKGRLSRSHWKFVQFLCARLFISDEAPWQWTGRHEFLGTRSIAFFKGLWQSPATFSSARFPGSLAFIWPFLCNVLMIFLQGFTFWCATRHRESRWRQHSLRLIVGIAPQDVRRIWNSTASYKPKQGKPR